MSESQGPLEPLGPPETQLCPADTAVSCRGHRRQQKVGPFSPMQSAQFGRAEGQDFGVPDGWRERLLEWPSGCLRGSAGNPGTYQQEASPHESYPGELMPATLCGGQTAEPIAVGCGPANGIAERASGAPPAAEINAVPRSSPGLSRDWCGAAPGRGPSQNTAVEEEERGVEIPRAVRWARQRPYGGAPQRGRVRSAVRQANGRAREFVGPSPARAAAKRQP